MRGHLAQRPERTPTPALPRERGRECPTPGCGRSSPCPACFAPSPGRFAPSPACGALRPSWVEGRDGSRVRGDAIWRGDLSVPPPQPSPASEGGSVGLQGADNPAVAPHASPLPPGAMPRRRGRECEALLRMRECLALLRARGSETAKRWPRHQFSSPYPVRNAPASMPSSHSARTMASVLPCVAITRRAPVSRTVRIRSGQSAWSDTTKPRS